MYRVGVVWLLPDLVEPVVRFGVVGRARERGLLSLEQISPREFATDRHRTVDDRPYGGGPGMVLKYEPMRDAIRAMRARLPAGTRGPRFTGPGRALGQTFPPAPGAAAGLLLVSRRYHWIHGS